jgi:hypothetical protein
MAFMFRRVQECDTTQPLFMSVKYPGSRLFRVFAEAVWIHENDIKNVRRGISSLFNRVIHQDENRREVPAKKSKDNKKEQLNRQQNEKDHQKSRNDGSNKREGKETDKAAQKNNHL